ncbi:MAG: hypothetical protein IKI30_06845, partial [Oxalobacter sp.]|nr:hypothetical protein [Oxalobacter sp.]
VISFFSDSSVSQLPDRFSVLSVLKEFFMQSYKLSGTPSLAGGFRLINKNHRPENLWFLFG